MLNNQLFMKIDIFSQAKMKMFIFVARDSFTGGLFYKMTGACHARPHSVGCLIFVSM